MINVMRSYADGRVDYSAKSTELNNLRLEGISQGSTCKITDTDEIYRFYYDEDNIGHWNLYTKEINSSEMNKKISKINDVKNNTNEIINLNNGWDFKKDGDSTSIRVNLPHQYDNPKNRSTIYKGKTTYSKNIFISDINKDNFKYYIRINSASFNSEIFINNISINTHKGGYKTFFIDVTNNIICGNNNIKIEIDNSNTSKSIIPLEADFSFINGIFRDVDLIKLNTLFFDFYNYGSDRVQLKTYDINKTSAKLKVKSTINNIENTNKNLKLIYNIYYNDNIIKSQTDNIEINEDKFELEKEFIISNPQLWNGLGKSNLYDVEVLLYDSNVLVDTLKAKTGFRKIYGNKDGFFLNNEIYPLRGINRHAENEDRGFALSKADHDKDFEMIKELGVNAIRLAHYPQDRYFIDKCNEHGIVIYIEIPWVNLYPSTDINDDLSNNIRYQFKEMIREYYNYPCICFWGMHNELTNYKNDDGTLKINYTVCKKLNDELYNYAKINGGNRLIGYATLDRSTHEKTAGLIRDYYGTNVYFGWYNTDKLSEIGNNIERLNRENDELLMFTEYGAGSNYLQGCDNIENKTWGGFNTGNFSAGGSFHPQEYQCLVHESYLKAIKDKGYINTFVWSFADFAVSFRAEGCQKALNDKGLVTRDRLYKKDVFYLYKAFLNKKDYFVHVNGKEFDSRSSSIDKIRITSYSNCDKVKLKKGDSVIKECLPDQVLGVKFIFDDVVLSTGDNVFLLEGYIDNKIVSSDEIKIKKTLQSAKKTIEIGMGNTTIGKTTYIKNKVTDKVIGTGNNLDFEDPYIKLNSNDKTDGYIALRDIDMCSSGWTLRIVKARFFTQTEMARIFSDSNNEAFELYCLYNSDIKTTKYSLHYLDGIFDVSTKGKLLIEDKEHDHDLVITYNEYNLKIYIDGTLDCSMELNHTGEITKINELMFGNRYNLNRPHNFKFQKIEIYDGALTQEEINNL